MKERKGPEQEEKFKKANENEKRGEKEERSEKEAPVNGVEEGVSKEDYEDLVMTLQRLQAEFENYKKRVAKEQAEYCHQANTELIRELLPILDNFQLALNHATDGEKGGPLHKGVELIYAQLLDVLESKGVRVIDPAPGERFDPAIHEALLAEQKEGFEKSTVIETLQKGYSLKERVLRTAKVKVAK